ncbi:MAG: hypothetical protein P8123_02075 [bacterium]
MKRPIYLSLTAAALLAINPATSYCGPIEIPKLVDRFKAATDLQRREMRKNTFNKEAVGSGSVANVDSYDLYDEANDRRWKYYRVVGEIQNSPDGNPYRIIVLYRDEKKAKNVNRGQKVENTGHVMKIDDEYMHISVWLHDGAITPGEERVMRY